MEEAAYEHGDHKHSWERQRATQRQAGWGRSYALNRNLIICTLSSHYLVGVYLPLSV